MRRALLILLLVGLVGVSGCLSPAEDLAPGESEEDEENGNESAGETQSDMAWNHQLLYDYVMDPASPGTADVDVPEEASTMTVAAVFEYWPWVGGSPGICSTDTELVIEVEDPEGEAFLNHTFDETMKEGIGEDSCTQAVAVYEEDPTPGEWRVSFAGKGIAVGKVSFDGS